MIHVSSYTLGLHRFSNQLTNRPTDQAAPRLGGAERIWDRLAFRAPLWEHGESLCEPWSASAGSRVFFWLPLFWVCDFTTFEVFFGTKLQAALGKF